MAKINGLDKLTYAELHELQGRVAAAMVEAKAAEKRAVREKMEMLAAESGFSIIELMGRTRGGRGAVKGSSVIVKYRNPDNHAETWSGRGRMANWLKAKIGKRGVQIDDFLA